MPAPLNLSASASSGATSGDSTQKGQAVFGAVNFKSRADDNRDTGGSPFVSDSTGSTNPAAVAGVPVWVWVAGGAVILGGALFFALRRPAS